LVSLQGEGMLFPPLHKYLIVVGNQKLRSNLNMTTLTDFREQVNIID
jgi:hypothetical protein